MLSCSVEIQVQLYMAPMMTKRGPPTQPGDVDLVDMKYEVHDKKVDLDRDDA